MGDSGRAQTVNASEAKQSGNVWIASSLTLLAVTGSRGELHVHYSLLSMFQKIGVAGPSSTPEIDLRQALG
ncbi:MAG: hypothetical protein ACREDY_11345, partial [Bradyrhizobium sp.]